MNIWETGSGCGFGSETRQGASTRGPTKSEVLSSYQVAYIAHLTNHSCADSQSQPILVREFQLKWNDNQMQNDRLPGSPTVSPFLGSEKPEPLNQEDPSIHRRKEPAGQEGTMTEQSRAADRLSPRPDISSSDGLPTITCGTVTQRKEIPVMPRPLAHWSVPTMLAGVSFISETGLTSCAYNRSRVPPVLLPEQWMNRY